MSAGRILWQSDDAHAIKSRAQAYRAIGIAVVITPGVDRLFAVRAREDEPAHHLEWDRAYLKFRRELMARLKHPLR